MISPVIGLSIYIVELLHAGYSANDDVDPVRLKQMCSDPNHFIVVNYQRRVETVFKIRALLGVNNIGWVGGPDAANALSTLMHRELKCVNNLSVYGLLSGDMGNLLISPLHSSAPLRGGGNSPDESRARVPLYFQDALYVYSVENLPH